MTTIIKRSSRKSTRRMAFDANRPPATTPIGIVSVSKFPGIVSIAFDQPVSLNGIPAYTTNLPGIKAVAASQNSAGVVEVEFDGSIMAATQLIIPYDDPAIRNLSGGFVTAGKWAM